MVAERLERVCVTLLSSTAAEATVHAANTEDSWVLVISIGKMMKGISKKPELSGYNWGACSLSLESGSEFSVTCGNVVISLQKNLSGIHSLLKVMAALRFTKQLQYVKRTLML